MKNLLTLFFVVTTLLVPAQAQQNTPTVPGGKILVADITQHRHFKSLPKAITSTGILKLHPKKGLVWQIKTPFKNTLFITNKGIFQSKIIKGKTEFIPLSKTPQMGIPFDILSQILWGSFTGHLKDFKSEKIPLTYKTKWAVKLTPKHKELKAILSSVEIHGDAQTSHVIIHRQGKNYDEIHFTNHRLLESATALTPQEKEGLNAK